MSRRLVLAVGVAAGCAVGAGVLAGAGARPSGAAPHEASGLPPVQQWPRIASAAAGTLATGAASALRRAATRVRGRPGPHGVAAATPATAGGVIPLEAVPFEKLSDWELDLLTTPDS